MVRQGIRLNTETTKAQILKIASYIFYRDGYEKGSLNAVARKVGISKAAIYYHFKNKEEILYNIIIDDIDRLIFDLGEISKRKDDGTFPHAIHSRARFPEKMKKEGEGDD
jgi:AcrR family transcriptional regulator